MGETFPIDPEADLDEANSKDGRAFRVALPGFFVSRYPVTVQQWRVFREDVRRGLWVPSRPSGSLIAEDDFDPSAEQGPGGWPVAWVSWYEALAYCGWLTDRLQRHTATPEPLATLLREGDTQQAMGAPGSSRCRRRPSGNELRGGTKIFAVVHGPTRWAST